MPTRHHLTLAAIVLVLASFATGCADRSAADPGAGGPIAPSSTPPAPTVEPIAVDLAPGGSAVELDNGWIVQHCEGDAPLLCVRDEGGRVLGTVEFGSYPATDEIAAALAEGRVVEALERRVGSQHEAIAADRAEGCGDDYDYRAEPAERTTVGGEPAVLYGFSGLVDGTEIERHRAYYAVHAGQIWVVNAAASDPEGCMAVGMGEFIPDHLVSFEPYLERIVAGMQLPDARRLGCTSSSTGSSARSWCST